VAELRCTVGRRALAVATLIAALSGCGGGSNEPTPPPPARVSLAGLGSPIPVASEGRLVLAYELVIRNEGGTGLTAARLEVQAGTTVLAAWEGAALTERLSQAVIPPGGTAYAFLWLSVDPVDPPVALQHSLHVSAPAGQTLETTATVVVSDESFLAIGPPLRGGDWYAAGLSNASHHRRAVLDLGGTPRIAQRFAVDWVRIGASGQTYAGDRALNGSYYAYGQEVRAVADGVVTAALDGVPENVPGNVPPPNLEQAGGNFLLVDVGGGRSTFYAHLIPGSPRVRVGDTVRRGDVLGLVGNSGNSTAPHLHFHVARVYDTARYSTLDADGLPFALESFVVQANREVQGERFAELPADGAVIMFAE
jgi:murein DD-endopeptidase